MCEFMTVSEAQCLCLYHELRSFYISMGSRVTNYEKRLSDESDDRAYKLNELLRKSGVESFDIHAMSSRELYAAIARATYDLNAERAKLIKENPSASVQSD